jgi:hypothetical protein
MCDMKQGKDLTPDWRIFDKVAPWSNVHGLLLSIGDVDGGGNT